MATFFVRGVLAPFVHPLFTAMTGIGLGYAALRSGIARRVAPLVGLLAAMGLHSLWNTSAGVGGGAGFLSVYVAVMVPVFLAIVAVAIAALWRERRALRANLEPEVASGVLTRADIEVLSSLSERRRALREAGRHGRAARRARRELHRSATELAFLRRHRARRADEQDPRLEEEEACCAARVRELSRALSASARTGAADGLLPAPRVPPAWYADPYGHARLRWWDGGRWTEHTAA